MDIINIRASSFAELLDCPARWKAKYIDGLRRPLSSSAWNGTALHAGTAIYDQAWIDESPITADDAAGVYVDRLYHPEEDVDWGEDKPAKAEKTGITLIERYCADIAPTQNYLAVEMPIDDLEVELPEITLRLTGTTDRVRQTPNGLGIADLKSGARAVGADGTVVTKGHGAQLGLYELLAEFALGKEITAPSQIIGLNTGTPRVGTGEIKGARAALIGNEAQPGLLEFAGKILKQGLFYGNPKSMLCSAKFCPAHSTCPFKE